MSGHSKWHNIRLKKGKADAQRGTLFTKLSKEIIVAAKSGVADPDANFRLKLAIAKARDANMPQDNINRALARAAGEAKGDKLLEIRYEGYGPGGVAVIVDALTDSRNRTASEMRYVFSRHGGNLGQSGCVAWLFDERGVIVVQADALGEEALLQWIGLDGVVDVVRDDGNVDIVTEPHALSAVRAQVEHSILRAGAGSVVSAAFELVPKSRVAVSPADSRAVLALLAALEEHQDVSGVYSNADIAESLLEAYA